jgi:co-chaperonin GroES (HSP10)
MDEQVRPDGLVLEIDSDFTQEEDQKKSRSKPLKKQNVTLKSIQSPAISTANKLDHKKEKDISFNVGDTVVHEEYGEGIVEKVGGVGPRAIGVVQFQASNRTRSFILIHGALKKV